MTRHVQSGGLQFFFEMLGFHVIYQMRLQLTKKTVFHNLGVHLKLHLCTLVMQSNLTLYRTSIQGQTRYTFWLVPRSPPKQRVYVCCLYLLLFTTSTYRQHDTQPKLDMSRTWLYSEVSLYMPIYMVIWFTPLDWQIDRTGVTQCIINSQVPITCHVFFNPYTYACHTDWSLPFSSFDIYIFYTG